MKDLWKTAANDAGGVLTEESFLKGMAAVKRRWDWELANPHGSEGNPHLIPSGAYRQGYGICIECGQPVGEWPKGSAFNP